MQDELTGSTVLKWMPSPEGGILHIQRGKVALSIAANDDVILKSVPYVKEIIKLVIDPEAQTAKPVQLPESPEPTNIISLNSQADIQRLLEFKKQKAQNKI